MRLSLLSLDRNLTMYHQLCLSFFFSITVGQLPHHCLGAHHTQAENGDQLLHPLPGCGRLHGGPVCVATSSDDEGDSGSVVAGLDLV